MLNWDVAIDKTLCKIGIGVIARDWQGRVIATTMRMNRSLFPDPLLAETFGAFQATIFGSKLGLTNIKLEGDSLHVIQAISKAGESWTSTEMLVSDIGSKLQSYTFWSSQVNYKAIRFGESIMLKEKLINRTCPGQ